MDRKRYTASNVTQNGTRFYSLTIPIDVLSKCCFVSTREESPKAGFQRVLDEKRALAIAKYIDEGKGTIPSAIILSAQSEAKVEIVGSGRTIEFSPCPKAFLILDGQHRVYGFSKSKSVGLRVPVIIYVGLSRKEESRLFIDINSKQKGVPTELLLDIKKMAEYENDEEQMLRDIFDTFNSDPSSILIDKLSPASKARGRITRVTFNRSISPITKVFGDKESSELFEILNSYLSAFFFGFFQKNGVQDSLVNPTVFRSILAVFPEVASKLKGTYGPRYTVDHFNEILQSTFSSLNLKKFKKPGQSYRVLADHIIDSMNNAFTL